MLTYCVTGLHVIATARDPAVLAEMGALGMSTVALDVTNSESIKACHDAVAKITGGRLDILVNNAYASSPTQPVTLPIDSNPKVPHHSGRTHTIPATDIDMDDVRATFETNVFGVMAMCQVFVDQLIAARGLIVNIASLAAATPYIFGAVYCASKGAVVSYSRTLRMELKPFGVRIMVGMTGTVRSQIASKTHRSLPPDSLYQRVQDIFQRRLTFSQNNATVMAEDYARQLVANALKPESPMFIRAWLGRPDWFWAGGLAKQAWWALSAGEWLLDLFMYKKIGLDRLELVLKEEAAQKKLN